MFPRSVAGMQRTTTRMSAMARFTINKLVTVLILGARNTTATTRQLPTRPMAKTKK